MFSRCCLLGYKVHLDLCISWARKRLQAKQPRRPPTVLNTATGCFLCLVKLGGRLFVYYYHYDSYEKCNLVCHAILSLQPNQISFRYVDLFHKCTRLLHFEGVRLARMFQESISSGCTLMVYLYTSANNPPRSP